MANAELRARRRSIESARALGVATAPEIDDSWSRCRPVIDASSAAAPVDAEPDEVEERWAASPIRRSEVGLEERLTQAADAGDLVAAVTDEEGRILWSAGGRSMRRTAETVGFVPGGRWDESSAGTNALGLALRWGRPASVFSAEHWCDAVRDWVCWSAPVRDRTGRPIGVIDLSGRWDRATPLAEVAVGTLARLVEEHLPDDDTPEPSGLRLRLLGHAEATFDGQPLALGPRQMELLAALALEGPSTLDELRWHVYGDRPISPTTIKAEMSHLRQLLGGGIGSRPYRLTVPVEVDVTTLRSELRSGDLGRVTAGYNGSLLVDSEAPFADDHRHVFDVALRESLLARGRTPELLAFALVHPYDEAVLERAVAVAAAGSADHHEAVARLSLARRG
ncbi:MAG TPA: hypothetical protein PKY13_16505 [Microthrixaceae bacterium]|nr:hypothetical protein [Microthrixaceae bacterium]